VHDGGISPLVLHKGDNGGGGAFFIKNIVRSFMVYQDRIETNLLQQLAHPETSEWFSIISGIGFEVNIVSEQNQA